MGVGDERDLDWEGCHNVRDLGGLATRDGGVTRRGAVVRSDAPDRLSPAGWAAVRAHGIRTVVDLRNDDGRRDPVAAPGGLAVHHLPLDVDDPSWVERWVLREPPPLFYRPLLEHHPERPAAVLAAIAHAPPGGVLVHCVVGRDRTGLISLLLLALAGVAPEAIAADHARSDGRLQALGRGDEGQLIAAALARAGHTPASVITALLHELDVEERLRAGGLRDADLEVLRARLVAPAFRPPGSPP